MNYFPDNYRAFSVGFDEAVKQLEAFTKNTAKLAAGYPPYNIVKIDENKYVIEVAVAGFAKQDLEVEIKEDSLIVSGKLSHGSDEPTQYLYKGIADRAFTRKFNLADTIEVKNTKLINGMLKVFLENVIPEHKKPKKLEIEE